MLTSSALTLKKSTTWSWKHIKYTYIFIYTYYSSTPESEVDGKIYKKFHTLYRLYIYIYLDFWPLEAPNFGTPEVDAVHKSCTEGVTTDIWGVADGNVYIHDFSIPTKHLMKKTYKGTKYSPFQWRDGLSQMHTLSLRRSLVCIFQIWGQVPGGNVGKNKCFKQPQHQKTPTHWPIPSAAFWRSIGASGLIMRWKKNTVGLLITALSVVPIWLGIHIYGANTAGLFHF